MWSKSGTAQLLGKVHSAQAWMELERWDEFSWVQLTLSECLPAARASAAGRGHAWKCTHQRARTLSTQRHGPLLSSQGRDSRIRSQEGQGLGAGGC